MDAEIADGNDVNERESGGQINSRLTQLAWNYDRTLAAVETIFDIKPYIASHGEKENKWQECLRLLIEDPRFVQNEEIALGLSVDKLRGKWHRLISTYLISSASGVVSKFEGSGTGKEVDRLLKEAYDETVSREKEKKIEKKRRYKREQDDLIEATTKQTNPSSSTSLSFSSSSTSGPVDNNNLFAQESFTVFLAKMEEREEDRRVEKRKWEEMQKQRELEDREERKLDREERRKTQQLMIALMEKLIQKL